MATNGNGRSDPERQEFEDGLTDLRPVLKAFARSLCHNAEMADDLAQMTILKALENRQKYEPGTQLKAWLFVILRNEFYSSHRKAKTVHGYVAAQVGAHSEVSESPQVPAAEAAYELKQALKYIACLPTEQADAIIATSYLDLTYEDAAVLFNCAVGTIKSRVSRARGLLLELMESGYISRPPELDRLQCATQGVPKSHKLYSLARAYEDLYAGFTKADFEHIGQRVAPRSSVTPHEKPSPSEGDILWQGLIDSGALDGEASLQDLMQTDFSEV